MRYRVGDRPTVREDLEDGKIYLMDDNGGSDMVVDNMLSLRGKVVTIIQASENGYRIKESAWHWVDGMFSDIEECVAVDVSEFL